MLLGANSRITYSDGKFSLNSTKQATSLMGTSAENDAMLISLQKGKFELSASSNGEEERYITYDASLSSKSWRAVYVFNGSETTSTPTEFIVKNIIFKNFQCSYVGGVIGAGENTKLNISNSQFISCVASSGGAIYAENNTVEINNSIFSNCSVSSTGYGGALCLGESTAEISNSTFGNCTVSSSYHGGTIYAKEQSNLSLTDCTISGCNNGAIAIYHSSAIIMCGLIGCDDPIDEENSQSGNTDAVYVYDSTLELNNVAIKHNSSSNSYTICSSYSSVEINGGVFSDNSADNVIYATNGNFVINGTQITNNTTANFGDVINLWGDEEDTSIITNATISNNEASFCTIHNYGGVLVIQDTTISNNMVKWNGGAIYNTGTLEIVSSKNSQIFSE